MKNLDGHFNQGSRVLIWSLRHVQNFVYNACLFEFEDIVEAVDDTDILSPKQYGLVGRALKRIVINKTKHINTFPLTTLNPYIHAIDLAYDYDIYFVVLDFPWSLSSLNLLKNWRRRCRFVVCYIVEVWSTDISKLANFLEFFQDFDLICIGTYNALSAIEKVVDRPCMFLAPGINTLKFAPLSTEDTATEDTTTEDTATENSSREKPPTKKPLGDHPIKPLEHPRSIDVCSLGRRSAITHKALLAIAEHSPFFYYHELSSGSGLRISNHQSHRTLIANLLKNSRYYITNYAKADQPEQTEGDCEIGYRFFEGVAAGNVLIGSPPKGNLFRQYFDWEDAIIPIRFDEANIADIIRDLDAQPNYLKKIRTQNVVNALRKHDWVYRWEQVLQKLGMPTTPALTSRKRLLADKANKLESATACYAAQPQSFSAGR